ncbi:MAG: hypothetical protein NEHIOOID_00648 [Holosporales bacterium]
MKILLSLLCLLGVSASAGFASAIEWELDLVCKLLKDQHDKCLIAGCKWLESHDPKCYYRN